MILPKIHRHLKDSRSYFNLLRNHSGDQFQVIKTSDPTHIQQAKKLHASIYLQRGFVTADELRGGKLRHRVDPHQAHSIYFVVLDTKTGEVVANARQIRATRKLGHLSFPMVSQASINNRAQRAIDAHAASDCVEISGLVKKRGVSSIVPLLLYRALWHESLRAEHTLWLMACDVRLYERLHLLYGPALKKVGKTASYKGGLIVPAILEINHSLAAIESSLSKTAWFHKALRIRAVKFLIHGVPTRHLSMSEHAAYLRLNLK